MRYGSAESPVAEDNVAPLRVVGWGCTITGLHVAGDIYTSAKYAGGLAGTQNGAVTIRDCHVSVVIHSRTSGDGSHGGLVGMNSDIDDSALTIEGCLFDGKLLTEGSTPTINCAGFVGVKGSSGTVAVTNSLYAPAKLGTGETEPSDGCATFVRNGSAGTNCYYTEVLGEAQGKEARTVSGGADVTVTPSGTATAYDVSGITAYESNQGLKRGDAFYAGKDDAVSLSLSYGADVPEGYSVGYVPSAGTLSRTESPYTLAMPDKDVTISAVFGHKVTVSSEISYGSVTSNKPVAAPGDIVTLTVTPGDGNTYGLGGLHATYGDGQELELTQGTGEDADKWTFQMPDADVTVMATFIENVLELADAANNTTTIAVAEGKTYKVTLSGRTLYKDGDWNTLCLPFDVTAAQMEESTHPLYGATIKELDTTGTYDNDKQTGFDASTGTLYLYFKDATSIEAGKPYIVKWTTTGDNIVNPVFSGVTIDKTDRSVTSTDGKVAFCGTYNKMSFTVDDRSILFLGGANTLYYPKAGATIGAQRAYFQLNGITAGDPTNGVRAFNLNFGDGEASGITTTDYTDYTDYTDSDDSWYSLDGRKLDKRPTKAGLYIYGGRKVVVK